MKCLVTGAAGFIGSHLLERLIALNCEVIGIDCFTDYYSRKIKEENIKALKESGQFSLVENNLLSLDLVRVLKGVDYVFHQAAQAGVRASWGKNFQVYTENNIEATQRLLEAVSHFKIKKFIYASSSSVYGDTEDLPIREDSPLRPVSPYGVTKLAGEHLCHLYGKNFRVPVISLRYFTVYGPRQRPDMAFYKFIKAMSSGEKITIYGDGEQTRDFTNITDAVEANILAMNNEITGEVFNIGGGARISINRVIELLEGIMKVKAILNYIEPQKGDVRHTFADCSRARKLLGYAPKTGIEQGLRKEVEWLSKNLSI